MNEFKYACISLGMSIIGAIVVYSCYIAFEYFRQPKDVVTLERGYYACKRSGNLYLFDGNEFRIMIDGYYHRVSIDEISLRHIKLIERA